jgi:flavin-dependent dehydrogenase
MKRKTEFDVIIVGARCAGAALATFSARSGARVLLIDRDSLPSDQVLSTHTIHPPGVDILDELGVGDAIRAVTPRSPRMRLRMGEAWVDLTFRNGRHELCPRRKRLDSLLQEAAVEAGAELRDRTQARSVLFENGRVVGLELEHIGRTEQVRARLVVGADGRHSTIAAAVGAEEYMAYDAPRAMYWAYWDTPVEWSTERYPFDMYVGHIGPDVRVIFQTDNDQLLIGSLPAVDIATSWRADPLRSLKQSLSEDPVAGPLVSDANPGSTVRGTLQERYFFRRGAGRGWALVGDAGHHKEFVVGDGITEALIQAKGLAGAISEARDESLIRWWRRRDVDALPGYVWGRDTGSPGPPAELETQLFARAARNARLRDLMTRVPEHQASPYDAVPVSAVLVPILGALTRGRFGVISEFLAKARRIFEYEREMRARRRLLEESEAAVAQVQSP